MPRHPLLRQLSIFLFFTLLVSLVIALTTVYISLRSIREQQLFSELELRAILIQDVLPESLRDLSSPQIDSLLKPIALHGQTRITLFDSHANLIGDSHFPGTSIAETDIRPEVDQSLKTGSHHIIRFSTSEHSTNLYVAQRAILASNDTVVIRLAESQDLINASVAPLRKRMLLIGAVILIVMSIMGWLLARRVTLPLDDVLNHAQSFAAGDLQHRLPVYDEPLAKGLATALNEMAKTLDHRMIEVVRQRNELEALLSSMVEGVIAVDSHGYLLRMNRAAIGLLGLEQPPATGKLLVEIVRHTGLQRMVETALAGAGFLEERITLPGKEPRTVQVHGTLLPGESGQKTGAVIVINDMTRIEKLERIRSEFVANVSHELRTPITSIKGFVETLRDGAIDDPDEAKRFLDIVYRQSERLNSIIEDLLNLSRIEREEKTLEREPCNLADTLRPLTAEFQERCNAKQIPFTTECDQEIVVNANAQLLLQAVSNLLDNAFKYGGGRPIAMQIKKSEEQVLISVIDHGAGIPVEHLERIFERFYRIDAARSRSLGGTGLGLAIVKHIANSHGGFVTVDSNLGSGSTFTIHLPV
ncbi:MAG: ATP-binding protein [bacterium]|nr:ATP-binding protein [bacterium]